MLNLKIFFYSCEWVSKGYIIRREDEKSGSTCIFPCFYLLCYLHLNRLMLQYDFKHCIDKYSTCTDGHCLYIYNISPI